MAFFRGDHLMDIAVRACPGLWRYLGCVVIAAVFAFAIVVVIRI